MTNSLSRRAPTPTLGVREVADAVARGELTPTKIVTKGRPRRFLFPVPRTQPGARPAGVTEVGWPGARDNRTGLRTGLCFINPRDESRQLVRTEFADAADRGYVIVAGFWEHRRVSRETFGDASLRRLVPYAGLTGAEAMYRFATSLGAPREPGVAEVYALIRLADAIQTQGALALDPAEGAKPPAARRRFGDYWSTTYNDFVRTKVAPVDGLAFALGFGQHEKLTEELDAVLITGDEGGDFVFVSDDSAHRSNDGAIVAMRAADGRWRAGPLPETAATYALAAGGVFTTADAATSLCHATVGRLTASRRAPAG